MRGRTAARLASTLVACAILCGGCSPPPAGADIPAATSLGSCPAASSRELARQELDYAHGGAVRIAASLGARLAAITGDAPTAIRAIDPCLVVSPIPGGGDGVLAVRPRFADEPNARRGYYGPTLVVYRYGGRWQSTALVSSDGSAPDMPAAWSYPEQIVALSPSGAELLAEGQIESAGSGALRLEMFRLAEPPVALWRSPAHYACGYEFRILAPEVLLESWVDTSANRTIIARNVAYVCPIARTRQQVWERRGDTFSAGGTRILASPYDPVEGLLGSLQTGDRRAALGYVTDPTLVDQAAAVVADPRLLERRPDGSFVFPMGPEADAAAAAEVLYWNALPAGLRGPAPANTVSVRVGSYRLSVVRTPTFWLVSGITHE